ncbi:TetR family transcriptional regulator [Streptomyces sp. NPDC002577]
MVSAAAASLNEQEYDQIQMRDVATRAGVALGTLKVPPRPTRQIPKNGSPV